MGSFLKRIISMLPFILLLSHEGIPYPTVLTPLPFLGLWQPQVCFLRLWICPLWTEHVCAVGCCTAEISRT